MPQDNEQTLTAEIQQSLSMTFATARKTDRYSKDVWTAAEKKLWSNNPAEIVEAVVEVVSMGRGEYTALKQVSEILNGHGLRDAASLLNESITALQAEGQPTKDNRAADRIAALPDTDPTMLRLLERYSDRLPQKGTLDDPIIVTAEMSEEMNPLRAIDFAVMKCLTSADKMPVHLVFALPSTGREAHDGDSSQRSSIRLEVDGVNDLLYFDSSDPLIIQEMTNAAGKLYAFVERTGVLSPEIPIKPELLRNALITNHRDSDQSLLESFLEDIQPVIVGDGTENQPFSLRPDSKNEGDKHVMFTLLNSLKQDEECFVVVNGILVGMHTLRGRIRHVGGRSTTDVPTAIILSNIDKFAFSTLKTITDNYLDDQNRRDERIKNDDPYSQESRAARRAKLIADRHPSLTNTLDSVSRQITNLGTIDDPITVTPKLQQTIPLSDIFLFAEVLSLRKTGAQPIFVKLILPPTHIGMDMMLSDPDRQSGFEEYVEKTRGQTVLLEFDALNGQIYVCSTEPKTQQKIRSALNSMEQTSGYNIRTPEISIPPARLAEIFDTPYTNKRQSLRQEINQNVPPHRMLGDGTINSPYTPSEALKGGYIYRLLFAFSKSLEQKRAVYLQIDGALLEMNALQGRVRYIEGSPRGGSIDVGSFVSFNKKELADFLNYLDQQIPQRTISSWDELSRKLKFLFSN